MTSRSRLMISAALLTLAGAAPAVAQTEIQWWHALTGANNDVVVKLAEEFNASQKEYKVVPLTGLGPFTLSIFGGVQVPSRMAFSAQ